MSGFGRRGGRNPERERLLFIGAAGATVSLFVVVLVVLTYKPADANQTNQQAPQIIIPQVQESVGTVELFAPERPVRAGTRLSEVKFKSVTWPKNQAPEGAVKDIADLKGKFAKVNLDPSNPIRFDSVTDTPVKVSLPLTQGMRAITIEVDETSGLEGYALAGTRVDVTLTFTVDKSLSSKILVQNARVLSYGGDSTDVNLRPGGSPIKASGRTITLEVSPEDALIMQTSKQLGRLGLIMRTADDDKASEVEQVDQNKILDSGSKTKSKDNRCRVGTMKIDGKDYIIPCDGSDAMVPVE